MDYYVNVDDAAMAAILGRQCNNPYNKAEVNGRIKEETEDPIDCDSETYD
jgi:hypothetical protein